MAALGLNCPRCGRQLDYVPHHGLTLYLCCRDHGPLILRPLVRITADDSAHTNARAQSHEEHLD